VPAKLRVPSRACMTRRSRSSPGQWTNARQQPARRRPQRTGAGDAVPSRAAFGDPVGIRCLWVLLVVGHRVRSPVALRALGIARRSRPVAHRRSACSRRACPRQRATMPTRRESRSRRTRPLPVEAHERVLMQPRRLTTMVPRNTPPGRRTSSNPAAWSCLLRLDQGDGHKSYFGGPGSSRKTGWSGASPMKSSSEDSSVTSKNGRTTGPPALRYRWSTGAASCAGTSSIRSLSVRRARLSSTSPAALAFRTHATSP
jgi:hypothetical protein